MEQPVQTSFKLSLPSSTRTMHQPDNYCSPCIFAFCKLNAKPALSHDAFAFASYKRNLLYEPLGVDTLIYVQIEFCKLLLLTI